MDVYWEYPRIGDGSKYASFEFAQNSIAYWVDTRGFAPEKLNPGLPFYGKPLPGDYRILLEADPEAPDKDMVVLDGNEVWYNGRKTLGRKVALAGKGGWVA